MMCIKKKKKKTRLASLKSNRLDNGIWAENSHGSLADTWFIHERQGIINLGRQTKMLDGRRCCQSRSDEAALSLYVPNHHWMYA